MERPTRRAWNTPCLVEVPGGATELVVSVRGKVRGFDPATGKELWSATGINAAELCPTAVAHDEVLYYLGHPRGESIAVRAGGRGDVTQTHVLWRLNKGSNVGSPVYHDGRLYWASDKQGIACCVDAASGEIVYEQRIAPRPGMIYASPLLIGDRLYYVSRNSGTYSSPPGRSTCCWRTTRSTAIRGRLRGARRSSRGSCCCDRIVRCIAWEGRDPGT